MCLPLQEVSKFLSTQYPELYKDTRKLLEKIELLKEFHKNETIIGWKNLLKLLIVCER